MRLDNGVCVNATEVLSITPAPLGGFDLTFRTLPPGHADNLATLGQLHRGPKHTTALIDGRRYPVFAYRVCPFSQFTEPVLGTPEAIGAIDFSPMFKAR